MENINKKIEVIKKKKNQREIPEFKSITEMKNSLE